MAIPRPGDLCYCSKLLRWPGEAQAGPESGDYHDFCFDRHLDYLCRRRNLLLGH